MVTYDASSRVPCFIVLTLVGMDQSAQCCLTTPPIYVVANMTGSQRTQHMHQPCTIKTRSVLCLCKRSYSTVPLWYKKPSRSPTPTQCVICTARHRAESDKGKGSHSHGDHEPVVKLYSGNHHASMKLRYRRVGITKGYCGAFMLTANGYGEYCAYAW